MRFSEHFELETTQEDLDFVDIFLERDIPVFLDPFKLKIVDSELAYRCRKLIISFFGLLIRTIKLRNKSDALMLLAYSHEANDARLGYSKDKGTGISYGKGISQIQADQLYEKLLKSEAIKTGNLNDLEDCALLVEKIRDDKISDIAINIIRKELVDYTLAQCKRHKIKTELDNVVFWNLEKQKWVSIKMERPLYKGKGIILVPKAFVGERLLINSNSYYNFAYLPFKQQEHLRHPSMGLVQIIRGEPRVTKKDLKNEYPNTKKRLNEFTNANPKELDTFKDILIERVKERGVKNIDDILGKIKEKESKKKKRKK